mgnify:FL=1
MKIDTDAFASAFQMNMTEDDMKELFASLSSSGSSTYEAICRNWATLILTNLLRSAFTRKT